MVVAIHINASQPHQREHAAWLSKGFKRHGLSCIVTDDPVKQADIHVVSGPHYAKRYWLKHPRTILLDRALYRDGPKPLSMASMPFVSLGWMNSEGGRRFHMGTGRKPPQIKNNFGSKGSIFLGDYNGPIEQADTIRLHPDNKKHDEPLLNALRRHKTAIGYRTTALITAALEGLEIECKDSQNIMFQLNWLRLLPYADWHYSEIESGEAWEHLIHS